MPRDLVFDNLRQLIAEVERLLRGYTQQGNWTLAQICHHSQLVPSKWLDSPVTDAPPTELQQKMQPLFAGVLASRALPGRLDAPPHLVPPVDAPDSAIADFLAFARERMSKGFPDFNHRFWGNVTAGQAEQLMLIHSANHLRFLSPTTA